MGKKLTQEEFVKECSIVHNNEYDYSLLVFNGVLNNIEVICDKHGIFIQKAFIHKSGSKCQECQRIANKKRNRISTKAFVSKAKLKHNDRYHYNKTNYVNAYTKIKITCPIHGDFNQVPHDHLKGSGCKKCGILKLSKNKTLSTKGFITKALQVHGNKYFYDKCSYKGSFKDVLITCQKHGDFLQKATYHLSGSGCSSCAKERVAHDTNAFVQMALNVHGNLYNYSKSIYKNIMEKITITCNKHGDFRQRAQDHLKGSGCLHCKGPVSKVEDKYFKQLNNPNIIRNQSLIVDGIRYVPDGYDPTTNTIYEVDGDYWHGNPLKFNKDDINPTNGKTFGYLYTKTLEKQEAYKKSGFTVISIWGSDV